MTLRLSLIPYTLRFKQAAATSRGALTARHVWFVAAADSGSPDRVGWGECGPIPGLSADDQPEFGETIRGLCSRINAAGVSLSRSDHSSAQNDVATLLARFAAELALLPSFAFGLETALLDLATGGQRRLWETAFARGEAALETHGLIWMDEPQAMLEQIADKISRGHHVVKLKVGGLPFAQECSLLETVRQHYSAAQLELRLDANGAFAPEDALPKLERLARYEVAFLEQPIRAGRWRELAAICRQSPIPICLDEEMIGVASDQQRLLLESLHPQHIIVKPALLGGFAASAGWIQACQTLDIQWWANSLLESNIGLNAICQWTALVGGGRVHGLGTGGLFTNNIASPLRSQGSHLSLDAEMRWDLTAIPLA